METDMVKEDVWIPTSCGQCYCQCGLRVHRVDGKLVKAEGNPKSPAGSGRTCSKALASIMLHYDPYRINYPLKRTNPEKGLNADPKWQRITWDEAMDIIVSRLKEVYENAHPRNNGHDSDEQ